jgi:hypothetical protein
MEHQPRSQGLRTRYLSRKLLGPSQGTIREKLGTKAAKSAIFTVLPSHVLSRKCAHTRGFRASTDGSFRRLKDLPIPEVLFKIPYRTEQGIVPAEQGIDDPHQGTFRATPESQNALNGYEFTRSRQVQLTGGPSGSVKTSVGYRLAHHFNSRQPDGWQGAVPTT